ncbi:MAG: hypothetical protein A3D31_07320 [Candidatus Fluviicola riflensis]|nr:MAG: hypothetical protein CHH17_07690 [Candidatus Fluviicola riflensis]OGS79757.1 MAG: hypothetical protein A3D31_07320 [Candidatus Fluviicola riflensis]OGS87190.1 MAG: hypothetical protein A2724_06780 [Fluviicola sp. RIFCSPHIGHO2_01_FULL_43_53]OGS89978.1 MAG: hypothetical protein A3E30_03525 [Fluviicola sp. RIFCSPHIGHO2_12_FULL_43_24]
MEWVLKRLYCLVVIVGSIVVKIVERKLMVSIFLKIVIQLFIGKGFLGECHFQCVWRLVGTKYLR